jgi:hypothetical protein
MLSFAIAPAHLIRLGDSKLRKRAVFGPFAESSLCDVGQKLDAKSCTSLAIRGSMLLHCFDFLCLAAPCRLLSSCLDVHATSGTAWTKWSSTGNGRLLVELGPASQTSSRQLEGSYDATV